MPARLAMADAYDVFYWRRRRPRNVISSMMSPRLIAPATGRFTAVLPIYRLPKRVGRRYDVVAAPLLASHSLPRSVGWI